MTIHKEIADAAMKVATNAAMLYLDTHGLEANPDALAACLSSWTKVKLPEALLDAKAAIDAGLVRLASTTFSASMVQAGIEAAKEAGYPAVCNGGCTLWDCGRPKGHSGPCQPKEAGYPKGWRQV